MEEELEIKVGRTYRAKRPATVGIMRYLNDRQVVWMGIDQVQYDSPSVRNGRKYPIVSLEKFKKWAGEDVTDSLPEGEWEQK